MCDIIETKIEKIKRIALEYGGKCLSDKCDKVTDKLDFVCKHNHKWSIQYRYTSANNRENKNWWCPKCINKKRKYTIDDCKEIAKTKGGELLSEEYIDNKTKLVWRCSNLHTFRRDIHKIKLGYWCNKCDGIRNSKYTIEDCRIKAKEHKGLCLSTVYKDANSNLTWKCYRNHIFEKPFKEVYNNKWCKSCDKIDKYNITDYYNIEKTFGYKPLIEKYTNVDDIVGWECLCGSMFNGTLLDVKSKRKYCIEYKKSKYNIDYCIKFATDNNGKCLSNNCENGNSLISWKCNICKNVWQDTPYNVTNIKWCSQCIENEKLSIIRNKHYNIADKNNGKCLYVAETLSDKSTWICANNHTFELSYKVLLKRNDYCTICSKKTNTNKKTLEYCKELAIRNNGLCLSNEYLNNRQKLEWYCNDCNNTWFTELRIVNRGKWCPYCRYKSEDNCRKIIENKTNIKFNKFKPKWLLNQNGNRMEFDGYNKEHMIAFEYHGEQHYKYIPHFHRNGESDLIQRQEDDKLKEQLAKEHGIRLIVIPYYVDDLETFIYEELMKIDPSLIKMNFDEIINVEESSDIL